MITRALRLPPAGAETFFLWGPRQSGKSTLLKAAYPDALWIDLLKSDEYRRHLQNPEVLRQEVETLATVPFVVIDEVQKVPLLLDEVHWLHENRGVNFALCGSSARKVRRGHANLLGGRAVRYHLRGLTASELGRDFDLDRMLNNGYLPRIHLSSNPGRLLASYVGDYLKEEVAAEGLVRKLPVFSQFLGVAALSDAELVCFSTIARECGVSSQTIKDYFGILEDTMIGSWLPAWRARPKRRVVVSPKFYFADVGVVNSLARRGRVERGSTLFGKAFENWVHHELRARDEYSGAFAGLSHWRLPSGIEVDFIVGAMKIAIEAKASSNVNADHLKGLRQLAVDHPEVGRRIVVCLEGRARRTPDGIEILPVPDFLRRLWGGELA
jgi:predicted AAA+ superfamily ATPase